MVNVSVLGATGYAGYELVRLLAQHPRVEIKNLVSKNFAGKKISDIYPSLAGVCDILCTELDIDTIKETSDIVFCALPHGASKEVIPKLYDLGLKIIDFSGDYRYKDKNVYEAWYNEPHSSPELLEKSVYGLCELHRGEIKNSSLVGNPGCYPTCSILTLAPLVKEGLIDLKSIIIDAKSGVSGAGRVSDLSYSFCELTTKAYKVATHRHTSEIEQELSILADYPITLSFTPHLIPVNRGIYATCYANLNKKVTSSELLNLYRNFYKNEYFIRVKDTVPELKNVVGSNFVDISLAVDERLNRVIAVGALDNLIKGAAGQAVQNMNIMFGFDEKSGLETPAYYI